MALPKIKKTKSTPIKSQSNLPKTDNDISIDNVKGTEKEILQAIKTNTKLIGNITNQLHENQIKAASITTNTSSALDDLAQLNDEKLNELLDTIGVIRDSIEEYFTGTKAATKSGGKTKQRKSQKSVPSSKAAPKVPAIKQLAKTRPTQSAAKRKSRLFSLFTKKPKPVSPAPVPATPAAAAPKKSIVSSSVARWAAKTAVGAGIGAGLGALAGISRQQTGTTSSAGGPQNVSVGGGAASSGTVPGAGYTAANAQTIIADAIKNNKPLDVAALDNALKVQGMHEQGNRNELIKYLQTGGSGLDPATTSWCAAFVNSSLAQAGLKGTGSNIALSFRNWGKQVDPQDLKRGDVLVSHRGIVGVAPGGHVEFINAVKKDANGRIVAIQTYGGNVANKAGFKWVQVDANFNTKYLARRATENEYTSVAKEAVTAAVQSGTTYTGAALGAGEPSRLAPQIGAGMPGGSPQIKEISQYIYSKAQAMGVDPNLALGIAAWEGLNNNTINSPTFGNRDSRGYSFGPYQLFSGSADPTKIAPGGMAAEFLKRYGTPPNASNWKQQVDFSLEIMKQRGSRGLESGPWYAVRDRGGVANITRLGAEYARKNGIMSGVAPQEAQGTNRPTEAQSGTGQQSSADAVAKNIVAASVQGTTPKENITQAGTPEKVAKPGDVPSGDIVAIGKWLQSQGIRVSENPAFGKVNAVHRGRGHYEGRAIDVNVGHGMVEANDKVWGPKFDEIAQQLRAKGYTVLWRSAGHYNHMHVEVPRGGANVTNVAEENKTGKNLNIASTINNRMRDMPQVVPYVITNTLMRNDFHSHIVRSFQQGNSPIAAIAGSAISNILGQ